MAATVESLAKLVDGEVHGDGSLEIVGIHDLRLAEPDQLGFVRNKSALEMAKLSRAGALVVGERIEEVTAAQIVVDDPALAFALIAQWFHPTAVATEHLQHPSSVVDPTAELDAPVRIGPNVVIGKRTKVGAGSVIHAGVVIGDDCEFGPETVLYPRVVVYDGVRAGRRLIVHAGAVLGSDGFGYAPDLSKDAARRWHKVPQVGTVEIGDDVEIGANSTVDCGTLGATRIGPGTKIDNLCHIGHNCTIGKDTAIAGFSALAGSTTVGERVTLAGHVVCAGHFSIADDTRIGGNSVLLAGIDRPGDYMGYPIQTRVRWGKTLSVLNRLAAMRKSLRELERHQREADAE